MSEEKVQNYLDLQVQSISALKNSSKTLIEDREGEREMVNILIWIWTENLEMSKIESNIYLSVS